MKQLERINVWLEVNEWNLEIEGGGNDGFEHGRIELAAGERTQYAQGDFSQRAARQPRQFVRCPWLDSLRHIEPAVRCQTLEHGRPEGNRRRLPTRRYEAHALTTRAP